MRPLVMEDQAPHPCSLPSHYGVDNTTRPSAPPNLLRRRSPLYTSKETLLVIGEITVQSPDHLRKPESEEDEDEKDDESWQNDNRNGKSLAAGTGIEIELSFRGQDRRIVRIPNCTEPYHTGQLWNPFRK